MQRLAIDAGVDADDPTGTADRVQRAVLSDATAAERRTLRLTAIPVSTVHDEYMLIGALQSYEVVFAQIAVELTAAIAALAGVEAALAARAIRSAGTTLREASPLWSLVATMQAPPRARPRRPADDRRDRAQRDHGATAAPRCAGHAGRGHEGVRGRRRQLANDASQHRGRMLGERRGTGYTEGVAYLEPVRAIPLFAPGCPFGHGRLPAPVCQPNAKSGGRATTTVAAQRAKTGR